MPDLTFSDATGRFRDTASGRFVSERAVRQVVNDLADGASGRMAALSRSLLAGELSLAEWQAGCLRYIKLSHVAAGTIANGGAARMTFSAYGVLGNDIKKQYQFMQNFAEQIASGAQPLNQTIVSRAEMYGQQARVVYEKIRGEAAVRRGEDEAKNILHARESCSECLALAALGWIPASEMPPVGSRRCLSRCRCTISRRRHPIGVAA